LQAAVVQSRISVGGIGCNANGSIIFNGGGGYGASALYTVYNGSVQSIRMVSNGFGYTSVPSVSISDSACVYVGLETILADPLLAGLKTYIVSYSANRVVTLPLALPALPTSATGYNIDSPFFIEGTGARVSGYIYVPLANTAFSLMLDANATTGHGRSFDAWFLGLNLELSDSSVQSLVLYAPGNGCLAPRGNLTFTGGGGSGTFGTYSSEDGRISNVFLSSSGSFYKFAPLVSVTDPSCRNYNITAVMSNSTNFGDERPALSLISSASGQEVAVSVPFSAAPNLATSYRLMAKPAGITISNTAGNYSLTGVDPVLNATDVGFGFDATQPTNVIIGTDVHNPNIMQPASCQITFGISNGSIPGRVSVFLQGSLKSNFRGVGCITGTFSLLFEGGGGRLAPGIATITFLAGNVVGSFSSPALFKHTTPPSLVPGDQPSSCGISHFSGSFLESNGQLTAVSITPEGSTLGCLISGPFNAFAIIPQFYVAGSISSMSSSKSVIQMDSNAISVDNAYVGRSLTITSSVGKVALSGAVTNVLYQGVGCATFGDLIFSGAPPGGITAAGTFRSDFSGQIVSINVTNGGARYSIAPTVSVPVTLCDWAPKLTAFLLNGSVSRVVMGVTNCSLDSTGGEIDFVGGGGGSAKGLYFVSQGSLSSLALTSTGSNYTSQPLLQFSDVNCVLERSVIVITSAGRGCINRSGTLLFRGGGLVAGGASGNYTTMNGSINSVTLVSGGTGYTSEPLVLVSDRSCVDYSIRATLSNIDLAGQKQRIIAYSSNRSATLAIPLPSAPSKSTRFMMDDTPPITGFIALSRPNTEFSMMVDSNSLVGLQNYHDSWLLGSTVTINTQVIQISIVSNGSNCSWSSGNLRFAGGGGVDASGTYTVTSGSVVSVKLKYGGKQYTPSQKSFQQIQLVRGSSCRPAWVILPSLGREECQLK